MSVGQLKTVLEFDPDHSCPRKLEIIVQMRPQGLNCY